jgi:hypothetical protein
MRRDDVGRGDDGEWGRLHFAQGSSGRCLCEQRVREVRENPEEV